MRTRFLIAALFALYCQTAHSSAAVSLASLNGPTMQTLIGLGSDGVTVGPLRFYDFEFTSSPAAAAPSAASVVVQPLTTAGDGLRFVSAWLASAGSGVTDIITYRMDTTDPAQPMSNLTLFCDGTAPLPAVGAFVSTSLTARTAPGSVAGRILSTIDDGRTSPVDTTQSDTNADFENFPNQISLSITEDISVESGNGPSGGVALASTLENTFDPVSVPTPSGWVFIPVVAVVVTLSRRPRRPMLRSAR
jgi:hypothetical protein